MDFWPKYSPLAIGATLNIPDILFVPKDDLCRIIFFGSNDYSDDIIKLY